MEIVARRLESWKGGIITIGACLVSLGLGERMQSLAGNAGVLLGLLLATAVTSWYAGHWAGLITTGVGAAAAAYFFLPPTYSFQIFDPQDYGALYSFAIGGVIISLLCGAAWQLRAQSKYIQATADEMARLRGLNSSLRQEIRDRDGVLAASDRLLREFARSARRAVETANTTDLLQIAHRFECIQPPAPQAVDCNELCPAAGTLPKVCADKRDMRQLFELLACGDVNASQLPDWWLFVVVFRAGSALAPIDYAVCERLVVRQGGRCWSNTTGNGDWECRFLLPRNRAAT